MVSHAQEPTHFHLKQLWSITSQPQTLTRVIWRPSWHNSQEAIHVEDLPGLATHWGALHAQTRLLLQLRQAGTLHNIRGQLCTSYPATGRHFSVRSSTEAWVTHQRTSLPLGQHKVFPSPLTEEQALICMGWQYARLPLLQMNPPDSWETFLKGSPAKGHEGEWPQALLLCNTSSPPRLSAEQACCEFPPHPGSICMQILPHLFLLPSERTNLV